MLYSCRTLHIALLTLSQERASLGHLTPLWRDLLHPSPPLLRRGPSQITCAGARNHAGHGKQFWKAGGCVSYPLQSSNTYLRSFDQIVDSRGTPPSFVPTFQTPPTADQSPPVAGTPFAALHTPQIGTSRGRCSIRHLITSSFGT